MSKQKMMTLSMLAALCMLATLSMHAKAQDKEGKSGQEGMVAVRDAQTGKMRAPTPQELRELRVKAPRSSAAVAGTPLQPKALTGRHGAHGVRLGEKTLVYDVVTRGEDGKLSSQCVHGEAAAQDAMQHPDHAQHEEHRHEAR
jgi:hypothetical protein